MFIPDDVRSNELIGAQIVRWLPEELRWEKKYLYGMRSRGACLRPGPARAQERVLVEGYATALSVEAAIKQMRLNASVLVLQRTQPDPWSLNARAGDAVIADNDPPQRDPEKAAQNPGEAGQRAAMATGLGWAAPTTEGMDANDLHVAEGLMAVCALVMRARAAEPAPVAEAVPP